MGGGKTFPLPFFYPSPQELSGNGWTSKGKVLSFQIQFFLFSIHRIEISLEKKKKGQSAERETAQKGRVRRRKDLYRKGHEQEETHLSLGLSLRSQGGLLYFQTSLSSVWECLELVGLDGSEPVV